MSYKLDLYDYEDKYVTSMFPYDLKAIPYVFKYYPDRSKDLLYGELSQIDRRTAKRLSIGLVGSDGKMLTRHQIKVMQLEHLMQLKDWHRVI